jgi:hypothetical protein
VKSDLEISKALALAIGWKPEQIVHHTFGIGNSEMEFINVLVEGLNYGRSFDYRDWNVIGPIAEKYKCFPIRFDGAWCSDSIRWIHADTPQKAIALAVIEGAKK